MCRKYGAVVLARRILGSRGLTRCAVRQRPSRFSHKNIPHVHSPHSNHPFCPSSTHRPPVPPRSTEGQRKHVQSIQATQKLRTHMRGLGAYIKNWRGNRCPVTWGDRLDPRFSSDSEQLVIPSASWGHGRLVAPCGTRCEQSVLGDAPSNSQLHLAWTAVVDIQAGRR